MDNSVKRFQPPEEIELERKRAELAEIENELAQKELDLETLRAELSALEQEYLRIVGIRYAELDRIEAEIAELFSRHNPSDKSASERAKQTRKRANESAEATQQLSTERLQQPFRPSDELKKLYREVAKQIHPDLAEDETERDRRHKLMAEANDAYRNGDIARLETILREWQCSPEAVKDKGVGGDLVRIIRRISLVKNRLEAIVLEMQQIANSDLRHLWEAVESAREEGRDLLREMAADLDREINLSKQRLIHVKAEVGIIP